MTDNDKDMADKDKDKDKDKDGVGDQEESKFFVCLFGKKIKGMSILLLIIIPFFVSFGASWAYDGIKTKFFQKVTLEDLQASIDEIDERVKILEDKDNKVTPSPINVNGDNNNVTVGKLILAPGVSLGISQGSGELAVAMAQPMWTSVDKIFINPETGNEITAGEAANQQVLLAYKNNSEEIYFLGQFNENNNWDKECLINVYENNVLKSIMEANYDDGKLTTYKQTMKIKTAGGVEVWAISDKEHKETYNTGITINYRYIDCEQTVELDNASEEDMIRVDEFEELIKESSTIEGYYSGNTSNGYYNDKTDQAYMAKYYEDGTIRMLYTGWFENGYPEDHRNREKTWGIVYWENGHCYVCNTGNHTKGSADKKSTTPLNIEKIEEIVSEKDFKCDLKWKEN